jgi:hypothetical protein
VVYRAAAAADSHGDLWKRSGGRNAEWGLRKGGGEVGSRKLKIGRGMVRVVPVVGVGMVALRAGAHSLSCGRCGGPARGFVEGEMKDEG